MKICLKILWTLDH